MEMQWRKRAIDSLQEATRRSAGAYSDVLRNCRRHRLDAGLRAGHTSDSGERRGKAAVAEFFKQVAEHVNSRASSRKSSSPPATRWWRRALNRDDADEESFDSDFAMVFTRERASDALQEFCNSAAINAAMQPRRFQVRTCLSKWRGYLYSYGKDSQWR